VKGEEVGGRGGVLGSQGRVRKVRRVYSELRRRKAKGRRKGEGKGKGKGNIKVKI